jgi:hypothetical protein
MWLFSIDPFLYLESQPWWWHLKISWNECSPSWWAMSSVYDLKWWPHSLHLSNVYASPKFLSLSESTSISYQSRPTYYSISSTSKKSPSLLWWHGAESSLTCSNPPGISLTNSLSSRFLISLLSWTDAFSNYLRQIDFSLKTNCSSGASCTLVASNSWLTTRVLFLKVVDRVQWLKLEIFVL